MLNKRVQDALNKQINAEFYASYLYLAMRVYFEEANLPGFAKWMDLQTTEERGHGMKIFDYIVDRNGHVELTAIAQPSSKFKSPLDVMQMALSHEQTVTGMINRLYELAQKENDYATQVMLEWFVTEQVEEEKQAILVIEHLKRIGDDGAGLLMLDSQMGERK